MSKGIADRILLEQDLHNALANNEFYLDYQPQVNLKQAPLNRSKLWYAGVIQLGALFHLMSLFLLLRNVALLSR